MGTRLEVEPRRRRQDRVPAGGGRHRPRDPRPGAGGGELELGAFGTVRSGSNPVLLPQDPRGTPTGPDQGRSQECRGEEGAWHRIPRLHPAAPGHPQPARQVGTAPVPPLSRVRQTSGTPPAPVSSLGKFFRPRGRIIYDRVVPRPHTPAPAVTFHPARTSYQVSDTVHASVHRLSSWTLFGDTAQDRRIDFPARRFDFQTAETTVRFLNSPSRRPNQLSSPPKHSSSLPKRLSRPAKQSSRSAKHFSRQPKRISGRPNRFSSPPK